MNDVVKTAPTVVSFLLDQTGSMQSIKQDTIGGFNAYLDTLAASGQDIEFSLVKFDSNNTERVCLGVLVKNVPRLTESNYRPGAMTPLIDAAVKLIRATESKVGGRTDSPKVIVVVQTDGEENSSTEFTRDDLVALVKEKTASGWQFVFLGANMDAWAQAGQFGFAAATTMSYAGRKSGATMRAMAANTVAYAATGDAASLRWSAAQRADAGEASVAPIVQPAAPLTSQQQAHRKTRPVAVEDFTL